MRTLTKTILVAVLGLMFTAATPVSISAQYNTSESSVRGLVQSIQSRTDNLRRTLQNSRNRGNVSSSQLYELNRLIGEFSSATTQLDRRLGMRRATTSDVRLVLDRAALVDNYFANYQLAFGPEREWQALRSDLDRLALAYNMNWQWSSGSSNTGNYPNEIQLRQLVQRIDNRTTNFSRNLRLDLNRRGYNGRYSVDQVRSELSQFEAAVMQLRNRVNSRQATAAEARNVLQEASFLHNYVSNEQLSNQTENNWNLLRQELDRLASTFNVSWNWSSSYPDPGYPDSGSGNGRLTGTYRINNSRSEDVRRAAELATRNLPVNERQRVYDSLLRRLDPPDMLALDQRGNNVTIASTRAPQIQFVANGREQVETTNTGRTVRVRATLSNDRLTINRTGDRAQDFVVTFETADNGRQLLVTRQLYSERFTQPVVVRSYYDRSSDVAQLNLYETNPEYSSSGDVAASGDFIVPNGTQLLGVLNQDLSTKVVQENDRFTMTVRSPGQFEGATIEGYVTGVDRAGRITGRSQATLNFDTIRLRDGRTYRFAGILENVRTPNGDVVRVDTEGAVRDDDSQTNRTVTRTAIGTAVGALIGAIAGGGKGAAIGAVIGAGAGAGSVYVQGRTDLELPAGTEITVQATGPRS
ncbi:MAG TPA: YMGG-like glycine zipper-containing protein [Pyrinomonadaceae bacterium]|nr:YMGG-like glycine zipper-containing protein [Pyrinomonadaceae bacterium]